MSTSERAAYRVGLFGRLGSGNLGNDATFEVMLDFLARELPDARVDCMCSGPDEVTARYGLPSIHLHWLHSDSGTTSRWLRRLLAFPRIGLGALVDTVRTASWVRRHDVVIVPGMGVLETTVPQRPWQMPYSLFLLSRSGRLFGTKVAFVCVGASTARERLTGRLLATAGRLADYRSFRDGYSLDAARAKGMAGDRDSVHPDLVFALPAPPDRHVSPGTVGVGVMAYYGGSADRHRADELHAEYVERMTRFVRWLADTGYQVRLLVGDAADEPVAEAILADVPVGYRPVTSPRELMTELSSLEAVVATRFHNVLGALACGRPTVAVGYGEKHRALMTQLGVGEFFHDARSLDVDLLKRQFTALMADRDEVGRKLAAGSRHNRALVERQFDELAAALFAPVGRAPRSAVR